MNIAIKRLKFVKPDFQDERNSRFLLVWGNIPHWIILDSDFVDFLRNLDGQETLARVINSNKSWAKSEKVILDACKRFLKQGILTDADQKNAETTPQNALPPIENISVNITNMCNLRCKFCFNLDDLANKKDDEITADEIISTIKNARKFGSKQITLAILGGEPFLVPEKLFKVAKYAISKRMGTLVSSNGTAITKELADQAKKINLPVQISIDGHNAKLNDAVRGKGTFKRIVAGIENLVNAGVHTTLSMVAHKENFQYIEDFYKFALKLGVDEARFIPLKMLGGALNDMFKPVSMYELNAEAFRIFKKHPEYYKLIGRDAFSILGNACKISAKRRSCGTGSQTFLLDSNGSLYPCLNTKFPEFKFGNIRDNDYNFTKIWKNSQILENFRNLTTIDVAESSCSKCFAKYWCLGGCKGETYVTVGVLNKRAYNCADMRKSITDMFWVISERADLIKDEKNMC